MAEARNIARELAWLSITISFCFLTFIHEKVAPVSLLPSNIHQGHDVHLVSADCPSTGPCSLSAFFSLSASCYLSVSQSESLFLQEVCKPKASFPYIPSLGTTHICLLSTEHPTLDKTLSILFMLIREFGITACEDLLHQPYLRDNINEFS